MVRDPLWAAVALAVVAVVTAFTRGLPYVALGGRERIPPAARYLGAVLPGAIMAILVLYCLRHVHFRAAPFGVPEFGALASVAVIHRVGRHQFVSVLVGTAVYMVLLRVFW